jgi:RHS repeat-associated protein
VTNTYGDSGRLTSNTGTLGDGNSRNYATGITYTAAGLMSRETFGMQAATLYHNLHYNNRQQLVDIRVGDSSTDEWNWSRGALVFYYGTTARDAWNPFANSADNNGNVLRQLHYVPLSGGGNVIPQLDDYNYDALNRITSVSESQQNSSGGWTFNLFTQNFGYDRWGNRTVSCSPCQPGVTGDVFTVDAATNRLTAKNGVGMTYDSAGNQTYDATGNRWFDGENRMYKATQGSVTSHYVYDADGKRVRRIVGSTETWMVYGLDGELVAEYAANGASGSPQKEYGYRGGQMLIVAQTSPLEIRWTVPDHLGTSRMNIRGTGTDGGSLASVARHDYLPFGEELFAGVGLRSSSSHGYEPPSDGVRQKFTGHERDGETGLDYMKARYCSSVQGRFTSLDPILLTKERLADPQTLGLYVYTKNNPLKFIDPDGERIEVTTASGKYLFTLDDGKEAVTTMTARDLYKAKTQWFEPEADNYMPLMAVASDIGTFGELKHFSWDDIAKFAEVDRWPTAFRSGGPGDWKKAKDGADGYLLVTVENMPYWADAIGQIPFAVDTFKDKYSSTGDADGAIKYTVTTGQEHGSGQLFGGKSDKSNTYDNYMILRGALWAYHSHDLGSKTSVGSYELKRNSFGSARLSEPMNKTNAVRYGVTK